MKGISYISISVLFLASCATSEKGIDPIDLPDYVQFQKIETKLVLDGKFLMCKMEDSSYKSFHLGNGKISSVRSNWGNAELGRPNYAMIDDYFDLIEENDETLSFGVSKYHCGQPMLGLHEDVYRISRKSLFIVERKFRASNMTYGVNRDNLLTSRDIGDKQCKLFTEEVLTGYCRVSNVHPDVETFLAPYKPKGL